jgi:hypothetical protein
LEEVAETCPLLQLAGDGKSGRKKTTCLREPGVGLLDVRNFGRMWVATEGFFCRAVLIILSGDLGCVSRLAFVV